MLQGTLDDFTLPEIFRLIATCKKSGCVEVRRSSGEGRIYFRDGDIYYGESARALTRGAVATEPTEDAIRRQIEGAMFDLLRWDGGEFTYSDGSETDVEAPVALAVENLIAETSHKLEELQVIAAKIPGEHCVPAMAPAPPADSAQISITPEEWRVLVLVTGNRTVADIAEAVGLDSFSVMKTLYGLASTGLIDVIDPGTEPESPPVNEATVHETVDPFEVDPAISQDLPASELGLDEPPAVGLDEPAAVGLDEPDAEFGLDEPAAVGLDEPDAEFGLDDPSGDFEAVGLDEEASDGLPLGPSGGSDLDPSQPQDDHSDAEHEAADAVADLQGALAADGNGAALIPASDASDEGALVDRLAAVKELADLFEETEIDATIGGGPPYAAELAAARAASEEDPVASDDRRRVEDDEEITRGLIARLIDGVKGL